MTRNRQIVRLNSGATCHADRRNELVKYGFEERPNTKITETGLQSLETIKGSAYAVLVGRNNCGKSFLLKEITQQIGEEAAYIGPAR